MARIVLVDDEAKLLQTLARFLEQQGHDVVRGTSFQAVGEHLQPGRFEMLISDIVMPDFDGMAILREVVEARGCQEPVVLITGEPNLDTASEAVRRGAFDYVSKPVTKDKLLEVVARGLRHVQLVRERDEARRIEMQLLKNLATLGESASVLTHEIRTPITSLRHALRAVGAKLGVEDRVLVEEFTTNLNRIERLLGETLAFARPIALRPESVALDALLAEAVRELQHVPEASGMSVDVRGAAGITLVADRQLLHDVVVNLLRNASEACSGKGHVDITVEPHDGGLTIEVADDGPGVPLAERDEIFKPFHTSKHHGTGIGLAHCRKVIDAHGGTIRAVDRPGGGACFRIDLPSTTLSVRP